MNVLGYIGLAFLTLLLLFVLSTTALDSTTAILAGNTEVVAATKKQDKADAAAQKQTVSNLVLMDGRQITLDPATNAYISQPARLCRDSATATPTVCPTTTTTNRLGMDGGTTATGSVTTWLPTTAANILN